MQTTIRSTSYLTDTAKAACELFMKRCRERGLDVFITETYRTQERQEYLYSLGRTRPGNKVTWTKNSRHTSRRAWDIACSPPQPLYDSDVLKKCGEVARELGITWGGDWKTPDYPHFEVTQDWHYKEVDDEMTEAERAKVQAIDDSLNNLYRIVAELKQVVEDMQQRREKRYETLDEVPDWARESVSRLIDSGKLNGDGTGLGLTYDMIRQIVILGD